VVHVNFGQAGFVFIEANVKKWGLAPMTGSLAPPPPYGNEQGSILLEAGRKDGYSSSSTAAGQHRGHGHSLSVNAFGSRSAGSQAYGHGRSRSGNFRVMPPTSPGPVRSPTDISLAHLVPSDEPGEPSNAAVAGEEDAEEGQRQHRRGEGAQDEEGVVGLGLQDALNPPPEYTSPESSEAGSRRNSTDDEDRPLIQVINRSRQSSSAAGAAASNGVRMPPIPSYSDAVRQGAGRDRSDSSRSAVREL
jgi:hypothetical protein